jgi:hypothetical protein
MIGILEQHWPLILAVLISLILLTIFIYLKSKKPNLLDIETKWLALSMIPVLIVLVADDYIYKFKGLGIEIETKLKEPIKKILNLKQKKS